jgi:uncharacterized protein
MPAAEPNPNAPILIDALSMGRSGEECEYCFRQRHFPRLSGILVSDQPQLDIRLKFDLHGGKPVIHGTLHGRVDLVCQRCMRPMQIEIDESISLTVGKPEDDIGAAQIEIENEMSETDDWYADPTRLNVVELVEEQVILALPLVPKHEDESDCVVVQSNSSKARGKPAKPLGIDGESTRADTQRPFANLRELLNK